MASRAEYAKRPGRSSSWIRREKRLAIYLRDGFACVYCGIDLRDAAPRAIGLDHLRPRSRGGSHAATNLVTACAACNFARHDQPWTAFAVSEAVRDRVRRTRRRTLNLALAKALLVGRTGWDLSAVVLNSPWRI